MRLGDRDGFCPLCFFFCFSLFLSSFFSPLFYLLFFFLLFGVVRAGVVDYDDLDSNNSNGFLISKIGGGEIGKEREKVNIYFVLYCIVQIVPVYTYMLFFVFPLLYIHLILIAYVIHRPVTRE